MGAGHFGRIAGILRVMEAFVMSSNVLQMTVAFIFYSLDKFMQ